MDTSREPMGWNSWDCYGAAVTEKIVLQNAAYMAEHLRPLGYTYVVVDIQWSAPQARNNEYIPFTELEMDEYGRLLPAANRFPSAAGGKGFGPLAAKIHGMGLQFGIHIMRGIPRQAVHRNTPIFGSDRTAREIAHPYSICSWNTDMYGVDPQKDGAQAYYDSLFQLYASWDVDFVKVDDIAVTEFRPDNPYSAKEELELIRRAIDRCGREMVLSLSPGPARTQDAFHLSQNANMWRMTGDFWDHWDKLYAMFEKCEQWNPYRAAGCWPDCDMLPLGRLCKNARYAGAKDRPTNFTRAEQRTMLTLWSIFRSPLMLGGELRDNTPWDLQLITNDDVLSLNRASTENRQLLRTRSEALWTCKDAQGHTTLALFNLSDEKRTVSVELTPYGFETEYRTLDLWTKGTDRIANGVLAAEVDAHDCLLLRLD